jgi:hypothetical protein
LKLTFKCKNIDDYNVVTPMLNPFVYSLKNKDKKRSLKKLFEVQTIKVLTVLRLMKCS